MKERCGKYGFYESIDYTKSRLKNGEEKEVVKTEEKVMHEGDKYIKSVQDLRLDNNGQHVPNSAGMLKSDMNTGTGHRYEFAPEDIKYDFICPQWLFNCSPNGLASIIGLTHKSRFFEAA